MNQKELEENIDYLMSTVSDLNTRISLHAKMLQLIQKFISSLVEGNK